MIDELCGCGFKDSCYVHCDHDLEACPGKPYKGSDLVSLDNQSQDEPVKSATPDIDTQIERILSGLVDWAESGQTLVGRPDDTYDIKQAHKAIKTYIDNKILEARIDELDQYLENSNPDRIDYEYVIPRERKLNAIKSNS